MASKAVQRLYSDPRASEGSRKFLILLLAKSCQDVIYWLKNFIPVSLITLKNHAATSVGENAAYPPPLSVSPRIWKNHKTHLW